MTIILNYNIQPYLGDYWVWQTIIPYRLHCCPEIKITEIVSIEIWDINKQPMQIDNIIAPCEFTDGYLVNNERSIISVDALYKLKEQQFFVKIIGEGYIINEIN